MDIAPLTPELLLRAYTMGVFPMAESRDDPEIFWVDPRMRGIFPLDGFHVSRSLARHIRRGGFEIAINQDFEGTVAGCSDRSETWINDTIFALYRDLHRHGFAHSLEVRDETGLIGGVYGVTIGAAFFGESMFSRRTNASKIALTFLVDRLRRGGFELFDTQFLTPHLKSLGATEIPRHVYHEKLEKALTHTGSFTRPPPASGHDVLQRITQTS